MMNVSAATIYESTDDILGDSETLVMPEWNDIFTDRYFKGDLESFLKL